MSNTSIYTALLDAKSNGKKQLAVLIDPDKIRLQQLPLLLDLAKEASIDYFFVGGSLLFHDQLGECLEKIRAHSTTPAVLFPGTPLQLHKSADALLLLSLISGRNPELLIGHHVLAAPYLKASGIETIATGYMLIDGGKPTSVTYISNTVPIPAEKTEIAVCTALAGEMLGLKLIYLDAGSGAQTPVKPEMIQQVSQAISLPLIVGGGLRSPEQVHVALRAGADLVVIGSALETNPHLLLEIATTIHGYT